MLMRSAFTRRRAEERLRRMRDRAALSPDERAMVELREAERIPWGKGCPYSLDEQRRIERVGRRVIGAA